MTLRQVWAWCYLPSGRVNASLCTRLSLLGFTFVSQWPCPEGVGPLAFFYFFYFFVLEWLPPSLPLLRSGEYANTSTGMFVPSL